MSVTITNHIVITKDGHKPWTVPETDVVTADGLSFIPMNKYGRSSGFVKLLRNMDEDVKVKSLLPLSSTCAMKELKDIRNMAHTTDLCGALAMFNDNEVNLGNQPKYRPPRKSKAQMNQMKQSPQVMEIIVDGRVTKTIVPLHPNEPFWMPLETDLARVIFEFIQSQGWQGEKRTKKSSCNHID